MERLVVAAGVVLVAVVIAILVQRRRPEPPTQARWPLPCQLDRDDFAGPTKPWLVAVFTSATCHTCADVAAKVAVLASADVAVTEVEYGAARPLHARYRVDSVPMLVIADAAGVVRRSFLGPVTATDLWAAVAAAREE